jgi:thiol-disulfide isomerase/thioredoxin
MKNLKLLLAFVLLFSLGMAHADDAADQLESLTEHFPDGLLDGEGNKVGVDALNGKAVGIYFSASWCPPCKAFSPVLAKYREQYKDQFDVVFVSSDRSPAAQKKYMAEVGMSTYTIALKGPAALALSKKYGVKGIPALVMLKSNGDFLTKEGRAIVSGGHDGSKLADPAISIKTETEEYKCSRCPKTHTRQVVKGLEILAASE